MAISTYKVFLMKGTTSSSTTTWSVLTPIKDFSDLGGTPEQLQTTTLSDKMHTYIPGIQDSEALTFTANYVKDDWTVGGVTYAGFETLNDLTGTEGDYAVWFGGTESGGVVTPDGSNGKFTFKGDLSVFVNGGGVNEVVDMTITITPSTVITES